jgi:hypothetical protein
LKSTSSSSTSSTNIYRIGLYSIQVIIEATLSVQAEHTVTKIFTNKFARYEAKKFSYWTIPTKVLVTVEIHFKISYFLRLCTIHFTYENLPELYPQI